MGPSPSTYIMGAVHQEMGMRTSQFNQQVQGLGLRMFTKLAQLSWLKIEAGRGKRASVTEDW